MLLLLRISLFSLLALIGCSSATPELTPEEKKRRREERYEMFIRDRVDQKRW